MKTIELSQDAVNNFFLSDPNLAYIGLPDENLVDLYLNKQFPIPEHSNVIGIEEDGQLLGILKWEYFTKNTVNVHFYLNTKSQGTKTSHRIGEFLKDYYRNLGYYKVMIMVPSPCIHVQKSAEKFGFLLEGKISECYTWRKEVVDILIYTYKVGNK